MKKLQPLPFEAQRAQSEWLLERFEQGLNSYVADVEDLRQSVFPPVPLMSVRVPPAWDINIPVLNRNPVRFDDVVQVVTLSIRPSYNVETRVVTFSTTYEGRVFYTASTMEEMHSLGDTDSIRIGVNNRLVELIADWNRRNG